MNNTIFAVLIDLAGIQHYVFQSNKLKHNLGGSWLIENVYKTLLENCIENVFDGESFDFDAWTKNPAEIRINIEPFEVGYIGGGNALLFFQESDKGKTFIKEWTKLLLVQAPGIKPAIAFKTFDLTETEFKNEKNELFKILRDNKNKFNPQTTLPRHGITGECSFSGLSMETWNEAENCYVSSVISAKIKGADKSQNDLKEEYKNLLEDQYCFTDQLDQLGQSKGEDSHIAIVHIDGNEMGARFKETNTLEKIRSLSRDVKKATKSSFKALLTFIVDNFSKIENELGGKKWPKKDSKKILPIRPIIIGGDDISFVCDGRMGIYFAKVFIEALEKEKVGDDNQPLSACAGVAITKTKYPFYRGYSLAEALCQNAKKIRKEKEDKGSWLDFHIAYSGFSGRLEEIRELHYKVVQGDLLFRPYCLSPAYDGGKSFKNLVKNTKKLKDPKDGFPRSKIYELRQVLTMGKEATEGFVQEQKASGRAFPTIPGVRYEDSLFADSYTPYFDMIELMGVYPGFEL